jgi:hypothetical protein
LPATPEKNNNQNQLDVQYADTAEDNMVDEGLSKDKFPYLRTLLRRCSSDTPYEHDLLARLFNHLSESPKFIKCIEEIDADGAYDGTLFIFQLLKHDGMQDVVHKIADRLANHSPKLKQQLRSIADVLGDHSLKKVLYPKTEVYVDTTSIPDVYIDQKQISLVDCDKWEVWKRDKFERVKPVRKKSSPNALKKAGSEGSLRELYELTVADVRMILEAKGAASDGLNLLTEDAGAFTKKRGKRTICFSSYFNRFFLDVGGGEIGFYAFGMSLEENRMWREACWEKDEVTNALGDAEGCEDENATEIQPGTRVLVDQDTHGSTNNTAAASTCMEPGSVKDTQFSHFTMAMKKGKGSPQSTRNRWRCG